MLDFTLTTLGAADGPLSEGTEAAAGNTTGAGASGDAFARALARFASERDGDQHAESGEDADPLGDPSRVVDVAGLPFLPETLFVDRAFASAGSASQPGNTDQATVDGEAPSAAPSWPSLSPVAELLSAVKAKGLGAQTAGSVSADVAETGQPPIGATPASPGPAGVDLAAASPEIPGAAAPASARPAQNSSASTTLASFTETSAQAATLRSALDVAAPAVPNTAGETPAADTPVADATAGIPIPRQAAVPAGTTNGAAVATEKTSVQEITPDQAAAFVAERGAARTAPSEAATDAKPTAGAELPAPYHVRAASAGEAGANHSGSGSGSSSHGQTAFAFTGGQTGTGSFGPALKFAGASFASALANAPTDDVLPAQTATQIVQSLKLQWARGGGEAEIRLEPRHFGELRIALKVDDGRVNARLEAEAPVVREWLQSNQAALRHSLADQNLTLEHLEVVEPRDARDADRHDRQPGRDAQSKPRQGRRRKNEGGELFDVVA